MSNKKEVIRGKGREKFLSRITYPLFHIPLLLLLLLITYPLSLLCGAEVGTESMEFLRMPAGVRQTAMGETGAVNRGVMSLWWNPAGLAFIENSEIELTHSGMYEGISGQCVTFAVPVKGQIKNYGVIGAGLNMLDYGEVQGYSVSGVKSGKYEPGARILNLGYGMTFMGGRLGAGLGLKSIREDLGSASGSGFGADIGCIYRIRGGAWSWNEPVYVGFSMQNMGASVNYENKTEDVIKVTRLGWGWGKDIGENRLETVMDYSVPSSGAGGVALGFEWRMKKIFNIRMGYKMTGTSDEGSGVKVGFGLEMLNFSFDYAYSGYGELGLVHTLGVGIKFGKVISLEGMGGGTVSPAVTFKRAMKYYKDGQYPEAVLEFNKVLDAEPTNEKAMEMMGRASDKIEQ